ncbi:MAG: ATP-binding protein [Planctomycetaceae bacterium]
MNTSLRTRLLLAILGTIIVVLSATQYGLYAMIRRQLYSEFDQLLGSRARALAALIEQAGDEIEIEFHEHAMQEFARGVRPEYYQVWHEDGTVLARSRQLNGHDLIILQGDLVVPAIREVTLPDGRPGRAAGIRFLPSVEGEVVAAPESASADTDDLGRHDDDHDDRDDVDFSGRVHVVLVVARDTLDMEASLAEFAWLLVGSGCVAAAGILGILALLVTRHLRPLQSLARQISGVDEQRLNNRFALADGPAELQPVVARLNELMARLEAAFLREKTFTADIAHELRTPLAGIRSILEVGLSRQRDAASYRTSLEKCLRISDETETIISTLLSLSRIESGQETLDCDPLDVSRFLTGGWRTFDSKARERNVDVQWCCREGAILHTDRDKLQVAVSNLFDNAATYVDDGGEVRITTQVTGDRFEIAISNTGCRLTTDQVTRVFDRFWRADTARSDTGTHAGLGLALTDRIIRFLDGTLSANVSDGRFRVAISLPSNQVSLASDADESELDLPATEQHSSAGPVAINST